MKRCVVSVATGDHYCRGQARFRKWLEDHPAECDGYLFWTGCLPIGSPDHASMPYAFKAHALLEAQRRDFDLVLWADASVIPSGSLLPLWDRLERDGYWISNNGWKNGEWCCDAALPLLGITREESFEQAHVVATAFGLNLQSEIGATALKEYVRFAENGAFRGPWTNVTGEASFDSRVKGHRHDQVALSVIAHRLGMHLTNPPDVFSYPPGSRGTILLADGNY